MGNASRDVLIRILTKGDPKGIERIDKAFTSLRKGAKLTEDQLKELRGVVDSIGNKLSLGVTAPLVGVGGYAFASFIKRGIEFNKVLEDTETAVAAVLGKFGGPEFATAEAQLRGAAEGVEELKRQAKTAPGTIQDLAQGFTALAGPALGAGMNMGETIDLTVRLSQAMSRLSLDQRQLVQEGRALVTGNITLDASLAKALEVKNEDIRAAKEQGNLYEFLVEKLGSLSEGADNATTRFSNFQDLLDQIAGKVSEPAFKALSEGALSLSEALENMDSSDLEAMGKAFGSLLEKGVDVTKFLIELDPSSRNAGLGLLALAAATGPTLKGLTALHKLSPGLALNLGKIGALGAAATVAFSVGTFIDDWSGFSDKVAKTYETLAHGGEGVADILHRQRGELADMAKAIETASQKEGARNHIIAQRAAYVQTLNQAIADGESELAEQYEAQISSLDKMLGALDKVLTIAQNRTHVEREVESSLEGQTALMLEQLGLTEEQFNKRAKTVQDYTRELDLLDAKGELAEAQAAKDEEAEKAAAAKIRSIENEIAFLREKEKLTNVGVDEIAAASLAMQKVKAERLIEDARSKGLRKVTETNDALGDQIALTKELTAEEERAAKLKEMGATHSRTEIGIGGQREEVFFNEGRKLGTEADINARRDRFAQPGLGTEAPLPLGSADSTPQGGQQAPKADLSNIARQIEQLDIDDSGVIAALASFEQRLNQRFSNIENQIKELGN